MEKKRKAYREFEGYKINGRKLVSDCEICGIEVPFVPIIADDEHIYCEKCQELQDALQKQEEEFEEYLPDDEKQDEENDT